MTKLDYEKATRTKERRKPKERTASWWWIPNRLAMMTCVCGKKVTRGSRVAYSHDLKTALCKTCARAEGLNPRPSRAWLSKQAKARR